MSAINFPINNLTTGYIWSDSNGISWIYDEPTNSWSKLFKGWSFALDSSDNTQYNLYYTDGYVGIGNSNPTSMLELGPDPSPEITFNDSNAGDRGSLEFQDGDFKFYSNYNGTGRVSATDNGQLNFIIEKEGNVGIGATAPNTKLHVTDTNEIVATLTNSTNADATKTLLRFSQNVDSDNVSGNIGINRLGANAGCGFEINLADGAGNEQNRLTIIENGRVGIGTSSPEGQLHIDWDTGFWDSSQNKYNPTLLLESKDPTITFRDRTNDDAQYHIRWQRAEGATDGTGLRFFRVDYNIPDLTINLDGDLITPNNIIWHVSDTNSTWQKADARPDGDEARLHWHGRNSNLSSTNFKHAWYDGDHYINVDVESDAVKFTHSDTNQNAELRVNNSKVFHEGNNIPQGVDLNDYRTTGFYIQTTNIWTNPSVEGSEGAANYPVYKAGILKVFNYENGGTGTPHHTVQMYHQYDSSNVWTRYYYDSGATAGWTGWVNLNTDISGVGQWTVSGSDIYYNTGNVGIGTDDPSVKLDIEVNDNTPYSESSSNPVLQIGNISTSANTNFSSLQLFTDGNGRGLVNLNALSNSTSSSADFSIQTRHSGSIAERMRILSDGRVGIGNTNPFATLEVNTKTIDGSIRIGNWEDVDQTNRYGKGTSIEFISDGDPHFAESNMPVIAASIKALYDKLDDDPDTLKSQNTALSFSTIFGQDGLSSSFSEKMRISSDGKVGIGYHDPASPLHVVGSNSGNRLIALNLTNKHVNDNTQTAIRFSNSSDVDLLSAELASERQSDVSNDFWLKLRKDASTTPQVLTVKGATGKVGIGTSNPLSQLSVNIDEDNSSVTDLRTINGIDVYNHDDSVGSKSAMLFKTPGSAIGWVGERISGDSMNLHLTTESNLGITGGSLGIPKVTFTNAGKVGIGTTDPLAPIHASVPSTSAGGTYVGLFENLSSQDSSQHGVKIIVEPTPNTGVGNYPLVISNDGDTTDNYCFLVRNDGRVDIGYTVGETKLSVAGAVGTQNGSEASPTHTFYSDSDTGAYRPAANQYAISTGGSERMRIGDDGTVLIGNSSSMSNSNLLEVKGSQYNYLTNQGITILPADGNSSQQIYTNYSSGGSEQSLALGTFSNRSDQLFLRTNGSVGIGTNAPAEKLDVTGVIRAGNNNSTGGGTALRVRYQSAGDHTANFGAALSSGAPMIGYAVESSQAAGQVDTFVSTADNSDFHRGALVVSNELEFWSALGDENNIPAVGDVVTMTKNLFLDSSGNLSITGDINLDTTNQKITFGQTSNNKAYIQNIGGQIRIGSDNLIEIYETDTNALSMYLTANDKSINFQNWNYNGTSKWSNTSGTSRTLRFGQYSDDSAGYFGPDANTNSDGKIDLGASDGRFRDGHFSGTVSSGVLREGGTALSSKYLPLSGGTITGTIDAGSSYTAVYRFDGRSFSWNSAMQYPTTHIPHIMQRTYGGWDPIMGIKTTNGFWQFGAYSNDTLHLGYMSGAFGSHSENSFDNSLAIAPTAMTFSGYINAVGGLKENGTSLSDKYAPINATGKWSDGTTSGDIHYSSGKVGIGTTNPSHDLEVKTDTGIKIKSKTDGTVAQIEFSSHVPGSGVDEQYGWIRYNHTNGSIMDISTTNGDQYQSGDGFLIGGSEADTAVNIQGHLLVDERLEAYGDVKTNKNLTVSGVTEYFRTYVGRGPSVSLSINLGLEGEGQIARLNYLKDVTGDFTVNVTNLNLSTWDEATNISIVVEQGSTAYIPNVFQREGYTKTIKWQGGSVPTGTPNGIDIFSFTLIYNNVLGNMVSFS